jgi:YVTN family beta-propeller protein
MFQKILKNYYDLVLVLLCVSGHSFATNPNTVIGIVTDENPATFNEPSNAAIFPNGQTMYVANYASSTVSIVDLATNTVTGIVTDTGTIHNPYGISFVPNGEIAYVINSSNNSISIIDTATHTVTGVINTTAAALDDPLYMAVTAAGTTGYVANGNNANITVVDLTTNATTQNIVLPNPYSTNIIITPDGTHAYVSTYYNGVYILDITNNTVSGSVASGTFNYPYAMAITADGSKLYVSNFYGNTVSVVDTATNTQTGLVTDLNPATFFYPYGMAISLDGSTLYVTNYGGNSVSVVNIATNAVTGKVTDLNPATFDGPDTMVITSNGEYGYVPNQGNSSVSIVFIATPISPPANASGCQSSDIFLLQQDLVNILTWSAPTSGTAPVSYKIYRDAGLTDLVATVPATSALKFVDHNRVANVTYTYYLVSVDSQGDASSAVEVIVNAPC